MNRLDLDGVCVEAGGRSVLRDLTAAFPGPALVGLVGPNGAGKTTALRAIAGLVASTGAIRSEGASLTAMSPRARAARIAYLPQARDLHWPITSAEVVRLGLPAGRRAPGDAEAIVAEALQRVDAGHIAHRVATRLSGGERARVLLARTLAAARPILLADEPVAALDPRHQIAIMAVLAAERDRGALVIATLHDLDLALGWCDRVICLDDGACVADGVASDVLTPELGRRVFGVEAQRVTHGGRPAFAITGLAAAPQIAGDMQATPR